MARGFCGSMLWVFLNNYNQWMKMTSNIAGQKRRRDGTIEAPNLEELEQPKRRRRLASQPVTAWSTADVVDSLRESGIPEVLLRCFHDNAIEGRHLAELNEADLTQMGIREVGSQKNILAAVNSIHTLSTQMKKAQKEEEKVFNDPIHGHIVLHPLMVKIIDTPQFQRLRYIKQLGGAYYVFPGASHNRFEHSLGVGYLAGELVETLQRKQPELDITDKDVLCVKIAGLCHDLGHGPFSHMFDALFIPKVLPDTTWKHEEASVMMLQHLIEQNNLMEDMERYGLDASDIDFIKELIAGPLKSKTASSQTDSSWPYIGRLESKSFLYEIVANKRNGVDVDKWDYFARDCHCLGIPNSFDIKRYMKFARVISVKEDRRQICTRDKEVSNLYEMFHTRSSLHRRAYQHKTSKIIETMITEALVKANDHLMIPGENGLMKMSEAIHDPFAYTRLTDCVFQQILASTDPNLKEAREILERVERRQIYKYIGQTQSVSTVLRKSDIPRLTSEIIGSLTSSELDEDGLPELHEEDIIVAIVTFDYGMKNENPIDHMRFYSKSDPDKAVKVRKDQVSQMLPQTFSEKNIRVYCRKRDKHSLKSAWRYFITWCGKQNCITPKGGALSMDSPDVAPDEVTPYNTPFGTPVKQGPSPEYLQQQQQQQKPSPLRQAEIVKRLSFPQ